MLRLDLEQHLKYAMHIKKIGSLHIVRKALLAEASTPCFE